MKNNLTTNGSLLAELRSLRPARRLSPSQAFVITERQATRLLRLTRQEHWGPTTNNVSDWMPCVQVVHQPDLPVSGSSHWDGHHWIIVLNADEHWMRQRFTLMHELFHIIDHPYRRFSPSHGLEELLADHFSACLLMPRRGVKRYWGLGIQSLEGLCNHYWVSHQAMRIRLIKLGLLDDTWHDCSRQHRSPTSTGGSR